MTMGFCAKTNAYRISWEYSITPHFIYQTSFYTLPEVNDTMTTNSIHPEAHISVWTSKTFENKLPQLFTVNLSLLYRYILVYTLPCDECWLQMTEQRIIPNQSRKIKLWLVLCFHQYYWVDNNFFILTNNP